MFTRRTATVIISAPDASCARTMTGGDEYLPVPTISREENVLSAIFRRSSIAWSYPSSRRPGERRDRKGRRDPFLYRSPQHAFQIPNSKFLIPNSLPAADEVDDLDLVSLVHRRAIEGVALDDREVVLHGDAARVDLQLHQKVGHGEGTGEIMRLAVQGNPQN